MTDRTEAYQFTTTDLNDPRIAELKRKIAFTNKLSREATRGWNYNSTVHALWRVRCMPRGGRVEAAWGDYRSRRAYDSYLPHRHGSRFDVYVHRDTTAEYQMSRELATGLTPGQLRRVDNARDELRKHEAELDRELQANGVHVYYDQGGKQYQSLERRIEEMRDRGMSEETIKRLYGDG